jgi:hypothetical protein
VTSATIIFETIWRVSEKKIYGKATLNRPQNFLVSNDTSEKAELLLKIIYFTKF